MRFTSVSFLLRFVAVLCVVAVLSPAPASALPIINEFVANHNSSDTGEFVEILGEPNTDYSDYWIVEVEGEGAASGLIDTVIVQVGTTDANGFWTHTVGGTGLLENGTMTILLAENFSGAENDDIDEDDDGVIDVTFWDSIADSVGVLDPGAAGTEFTYGMTELASNFDGGAFTVGGASRIPNGTDTDSPSDWVRNVFNIDNSGILIGQAFNTPNAVNSVEVPEPASVVLMLVAGLALVGLGRRNAS